MKTIIITGASAGIGAELARQIAKRDGARVALVLAARRQVELDRVAAQCRAFGARAETIVTDVSDRADCLRLIDQTISQFGQIDVLVNNAGMSAHANFADTTYTDLAWYQDLMTVNYWSVVWLTHAALPHLLQCKGQVVGVSSLAGLIGVPGRTAYCSTKFAMNGFLEALRAELSHKGLRVTLAYPGTIDTAIRKTGYALGGDAPGVSMLRDDKAMSVEACARLIRLGMEKNQREIVMTPKARLGRWLRLIAPSLIDRLAMKEIKDAYRP